MIARGRVEIYYNDNVLTADQVIYDQSANTLTAIGNAKLRQPDGAIIYGEKIEATTDFAEAFVQTLSVVGRDDSRIVAVRAIRRNGTVTEYEKGKFTACQNDPGRPPLWCVAAQRIVQDTDKKTFTYQDAQFEIYGVPVFYTPYFSHPDPSVRSQTGLLSVEYTSSTRLGNIVEVPYQITLAPTYDFLFHPMYTSKWGVLWKGDWRQTVRIGGATGIYSVNMAAIDQGNTNDVADIAKADQSKWRGSVDTHGRFSLSSWWDMGWDVVAQSDESFRRFYRIDNILDANRVNSVFMRGISPRDYFGIYLYQLGGYRLNETPQTDPNNFVRQPQALILPVIDYNYVFADPVLGGELTMNSHAMSFQQSLSFTDAMGIARNPNSEVNRALVNINWRRKFVDPLGQVFVPYASVRGDVISTKETIDPTTRLLLDQQASARATGTAGLTYSYPFVANTSTASHVIEPVGQILSTSTASSIDQRRLPNLDARSVILDDINLFEVDKLSGYDRIDTGVRANYGMQYTYQANSGGSARFLAGQSTRLSGENIYRNPGIDPTDGSYIYSPVSGLQRNMSDYVAGLYLSPFSQFRSVAQVRLDEKTLNINRADLFSAVNYGPLVAQAGYSYTAASSLLSPPSSQQEILGLFGVRLTDRWSVLGQMRFDLTTQVAIQDTLQLRYADECFVMTTSYVETRINDPIHNIVPDRTLMLRFELKYLGEYSYNTTILNSLFGSSTPTP